MKKQQLFDAINNLAKDLGLYHWIEINDLVHVPMAMNTLSSVAWYKNFPENNNTKLIREQLDNLWIRGGMKFLD